MASITEERAQVLIQQAMVSTAENFRSDASGIMSQMTGMVDNAKTESDARVASVTKNQQNLIDFINLRQTEQNENFADSQRRQE